MPLDAEEVATLLDEIGQRLELAGEDRFKAKAYYRAADSLRALPEPLENVIAEGRLREIPGVGEAISEKIESLHATGTHRALERLRQDAPESLLELLDVPGLPAAKIRTLHQQLGIQSIAGLEAAAHAGKIAALKGFGPRMQEKLLGGIRIMRETAGMMHMHTAHARAEAACERMRAAAPGADFLPAGEVRRGNEVVRSLAIAGRSPEIRGIERSEMAGVEATLSSPEQFGVAMLLATGPEEHVARLAEIARSRGLALRDDGLYRDGAPVSCPEEADVYQALGLPFVEPELRDTPETVDRALAGRLPTLITRSDLRGVLHCHTDFSDGVDTLEAMAEAARERGCEYFGLADHSQLASYAGGLKPDRVRDQHALADRLNAQYAGTGFRILKGTECDILTDGRLDYDDALLSTFDYVVASIHSRFSLEEELQTARLIRAVSNPHVTILGHMTGRLLLSREGYKMDVEAVLEACAKNGVAVEVNANPHRLDLDWRWHARALELGCMLSINPDAHSTAELDLVRWGVQVARKGGVPPERVLNCMRVGELAKHLRR